MTYINLIHNKTLDRQDILHLSNNITQTNDSVIPKHKFGLIHLFIKGPLSLENDFYTLMVIVASGLTCILTVCTNNQVFRLCKLKYARCYIM